MDYKCKVHMNQHFVVSHVSGQNSFTVDITDATHLGKPNQVELRVEDDPRDLEQTRGKQYWVKNPTVSSITEPLVFGRVFG